MAAMLISAQAVDYDGAVLSGAKLNVYDAGTTTPRAIYASKDLASGASSANPAVATATGGIAVWVDDSAGDIKVTLTNSAGTTTYYSQDNIDPTNGNIVVFPLGGSDQTTGTGDSVAFANLTVGAVAFSGVTADPNADRIMFWDDSDAQVEWLSVGTGLSITGNALSLDGDLEDISGLTPADGAVIIGDGTDFTTESGPTLRASLGLEIGVDVLAYDANLQAFASAFTAPTADGTAGQYLKTDGAGVLAFATPAGGGDTLAAADETVSGDWAFTGSLDFSSVGNAATIRTDLGLGDFIDAGNYASAQLAADAAHGKIFHVPDGEAVTISVATSGGDFTLPSQALDAVSGWTIGREATVTINVGAGTFTETAEVEIDHPYGAQISIAGTVSADKSIASLTSVTKQSDTFNGTGAQTAFTLSSAPGHNSAVNVWVDGVWQEPDGDNINDYSISGTTLTFTSAPASGTSNIEVIFGWDVQVETSSAFGAAAGEFARIDSWSSSGADGECVKGGWPVISNSGTTLVFRIMARHAQTLTVGTFSSGAVRRYSSIWQLYGLLGPDGQSGGNAFGLLVRSPFKDIDKLAIEPANGYYDLTGVATDDGAWLGMGDTGCIVYNFPKHNVWTWGANGFIRADRLRTCAAGEIGLYVTAGADGKFIQGVASGCRTGVSIKNGKVEASPLVAAGNYSQGVACGDTGLLISSSASIQANGKGVNVNDRSFFASLSSADITNNMGEGVDATGPLVLVRLNGGDATTNNGRTSGNDIDVAEGATVDYSSGTGTPSSNVTLNERSVAGAVVTNWATATDADSDIDYVYNTTSESLFVGNGAGAAQLDGGIRNTSLGKDSLAAITTGDYNTAFGWRCGDSLTTAVGNAVFGYNALQLAATGNYNIAFGYAALTNQNSGINGNVAVGGFAGEALTTGTESTFIGFEAGKDITDGTKNTIIGYKAGDLLINGDENVAVGTDALGSANGDANNNTVVGTNAGAGITSGDNNVCVGRRAGDNITTGTGNIIIGQGVDADSATGSNQINIGNAIKCTAGTQVIGDQQSAIASMTNSTGGTADGTMAACGDTSTGDQSGVINDNFTEINAKLDAILAAMRTHGLIAS
jgi:hypothetical protein